MAVVALIELAQAEVIEKILRGHQNGAMVGDLSRSSAARSSPGHAGARYRWLPPFGRRASRTDLRGHGHLSDDLLKITGASSQGCFTRATLSRTGTTGGLQTTRRARANRSFSIVGGRQGGYGRPDSRAPPSLPG